MEAVQAPIEALADIAPSLKEAELRVLLELLRRQERTKKAVKASSREIATDCKMGRSNVVLAIDALTTRGLITTRQGSATAPAVYQVNVHRTMKMGGPVTGPPPAKRWSQNETTLDLFQDHSSLQTKATLFLPPVSILPKN